MEWAVRSYPLSPARPLPPPAEAHEVVSGNVLLVFERDLIAFYVENSVY
jgi:hypothetical protein